MSFSKLLINLIFNFIKILEENQDDLPDDVKSAFLTFLQQYQRAKEGFYQERSYSFRLRCLKQRLFTCTCLKHSE